MRNTKILDVTCGDRTIWFQKDEPHTIYCDKRREEWEGDFGNELRNDGRKKHRHLVIDPDILCDFTSLPFKDNSFSLVVFDPPTSSISAKTAGCVNPTALWKATGNP